MAVLLSRRTLSSKVRDLKCGCQKNFDFLSNSAREHLSKITIVKRWYVFSVLFCSLLRIRFTREYFSTVSFLISPREWEQSGLSISDRFYVHKLWLRLHWPQEHTPQKQGSEAGSYQPPEQHQESGPSRTRHPNLKFAVCVGEESKATKGTMDFRINMQLPPFPVHTYPCNFQQ